MSSSLDCSASSFFNNNIIDNNEKRMINDELQFSPYEGASTKSIKIGSLIASYDDLTIYWRKKIDATSIWQEYIKHIFANTVNLFLLVLILFGLAKLLLILWQLSWVFSFELLMSRDLVLFWLAVLAGSYLIFRIKNRYQKQLVQFKQDYDLNKNNPATAGSEINIADSFNREAIQIVEKSWRIAKQYRQAEINPITLLLAVLDSKKLIGVMARLGVSLDDVKIRVQNILNSHTGAKTSEINISDKVERILLRSYYFASQKHFQWVGVPSLLQSIITEDEQVQDVFYDLEIDLEKVRQVIHWLSVNEKLYEQYKRYRRLARFKPKNSMNRSMTAIATPYLDHFAQDMTLAARYGHLQLCVGREKEIAEVFRIIESGIDSVILVGYPGVGKTAIIDGIAERMVTEDVPKILQDKRLVSLSLPRLIAGATSPGVLEERVLRIHNEMVRAGNVVMVIENIHDVVGINTEKGEGLDLSEVFADMVSDDRFLILTTSTPVEYRKSLAGKPLGNALQKVEVAEPDKEATLEVMAAKVNIFEHRHRVYFSFDALDKAIEFSDRYMHDFWLPEKAIKILEEVAVYVKKKKGERSLVEGEDVAALISEKVNIPLTKITTDESAKLLNLEEEIHQRIIGQEEAVIAVSSALRRARTELRDQSRPIVNLLFLGPTGVGKTELAKTIAVTYFGNSDDMVRLDMSEYQEKNSIARLIGSESDPSAGLLTQGIKQNPYTVLLLDEIEKAHADILNIFLQVMDDGRLTDWSGNTIDFTNTIIISTSNAGANYIQDELRKGTHIETIREVIITEKLKGIFRPEFLNRFDNVIVFKPLSEDNIKAIARLMIKKSQDRLLQKGIHLEVSEAALVELASLGYDPLFGARPMRRVIQDKVDDALAKYLLAGKIGRRDVVILEPGGKVRVEKAESYI